MRIFFLWLTFLLTTGFIVRGQDNVVQALKREINRTIKKDNDTTGWKWKRGGLFSFNLAQGSLSNWAAGGDNFSLSANG